MLRIGVIVNPIAGLGGPAALKGSDGIDTQRIARARGAVPRSAERVRAAFAPLSSRSADFALVTWGGAMGADALIGIGLRPQVLGVPHDPSTAADTQAAARAMLQHGVDVLVFAGGDGTARDLAAVMPTTIPVLGIPAGVKMHSGVFGITPADVGEIIRRMLDGGLVAAEIAEVRDIDEAALREGRVATRYYGELGVPRVGGYLQHVKSGDVEVEELVLEEIAHTVTERLAARRDVVVLGPGSTVAAIKRRLGIEPTLLGFDVLKDGECAAADADATTLARLVDADTKLVLSFTRGQGFLIGRGNQQLTPEILRRIPRANIWVVATRTKLATLSGRPLRVDSGDRDLDRRLGGLIESSAATKTRCGIG